MESIIWDLPDDEDGNVQHLAQHDVTVAEAEDVLRNHRNPTEPSATGGRFATFGWTETGRHIIVVWDEVDKDPKTIRPVTAYDVPPKRRR